MATHEPNIGGALGTPPEATHHSGATTTTAPDLEAIRAAACQVDAFLRGALALIRDHGDSDVWAAAEILSTALAANGSVMELVDEREGAALAAA